MPVLILAHDKRSMTVNLSEEFCAISTLSFLRKNSQPPSKQFVLNSKIIIAKFFKYKTVQVTKNRCLTATIFIFGKLQF